MICTYRKEDIDIKAEAGHINIYNVKLTSFKHNASEIGMKKPRSPIWLKMVAELRERNRKPWRAMVLEMMRRLPLGKVGFHVFVLHKRLIRISPTTMLI